MILTLFIILVCYLPVAAPFLPATHFGAGVPDIDVGILVNYLIVLIFMFYIALTNEIMKINKWLKILIIYSLIVFASISWSNYSYSGSELTRYFGTVFLPLLSAIMALWVFRETGNIYIYIKNITIATFILSIISISQGIFGGFERSKGSFGDPNHLAIYLNLMFPCIFFAIENRIISKFIGGMIAAFAIGGVLCTVSRTGTIGCFLVFLTYHFLKGYKKQVVLILLAGFITALTLVSFSKFERFNKEEFIFNLKGKLAMASAGLDMVKKRPLIGLGWKGYSENFVKYFPYSTKDKYDAHNMFITALTNYGLIGFIFFLCIFLHPLRYSLRTLGQKEIQLNVNMKVSRDLAIMCISSIIPFMASGFFSGAIFYKPRILSALYCQIIAVLSMSKHTSNGMN